MTTTLRVTGMSCGHCVAAVKEALESVPGVKAANVNLDAGTAVVDADDSATAEQMIAAVTEEGYGAQRA